MQTHASMTIALAAALGLHAGCDCAYGGPGCSDPWAAGLCEARIGTDAPVAIDILFGDDTGLHPAVVSAVRSGDLDTALAALGPAPATVVLLGLTPGVTPIELQVDGWETPVWFALSVEATAPTYACDDTLDEPAFGIVNHGPMPR